MNENRMVVIEAAHYEEARQALVADPIVIAMAKGLAGVPLEDMAHPSGGPRHEFMLAANREYAERGGQNGAHLGAVAEALLRLVKAERGLSGEWCPRCDREHPRPIGDQRVNFCPNVKPEIREGDRVEVVDRPGLQGEVLEVFADEGIAKVHFPDGFALAPGGPIAGHEWHVRIANLRPVGGAA